MVMHIEMPHKSAAMSPPIRFSKDHQSNIIVITVYEIESGLISKTKPGTRSYIINNSNPKELVQALIHICNESAKELLYLDEDMLNEITVDTEDKESKRVLDGDLSRREKEVLQLLSKGASNRKIASALFISENTVKTHLRNIMNKLGVVNRSQAAVYAVKGKYSNK